MSAADHLSQLEFPGMPLRVDTPAAEQVDDLESKFAASYPTDGAHQPHRWGKVSPLDADNPIYRPDAWATLSTTIDQDVSAGRYDTTRSEEFIPPWRAISMQGSINPDAVEHQVQHADPLNLREDPEVHAVQQDGEEHYFVTEGNHRTLAAQRRGQLLMPANVERMV